MHHNQNLDNGAATTPEAPAVVSWGNTGGYDFIQNDDHAEHAPDQEDVHSDGQGDTAATSSVLLRASPDTVVASSPQGSLCPAPLSPSKFHMADPTVAASLLPSPRTVRSLTLASAPIKRKPLSSAASPLATRYSTPFTPMPSIPEHRGPRSISADNPNSFRHGPSDLPAVTNQHPGPHLGSSSAVQECVVSEYYAQDFGDQPVGLDPPQYHHPRTPYLETVRADAHAAFPAQPTLDYDDPDSKQQRNDPLHAHGISAEGPASGEPCLDSESTSGSEYSEDQYQPTLVVAAAATTTSPAPKNKQSEPTKVFGLTFPTPPPHSDPTSQPRWRQRDESPLPSPLAYCASSSHSPSSSHSRSNSLSPSPAQSHSLTRSPSPSPSHAHTCTVSSDSTSPSSPLSPKNQVSSAKKKLPSPPHIRIGPAEAEDKDSVSSDNNNNNNTHSPSNSSHKEGDSDKAPFPPSPASSHRGSFFSWALSPSWNESSDKASFSPLPSPALVEPSAPSSSTDELLLGAYGIFSEHSPRASTNDTDRTPHHNGTPTQIPPLVVSYTPLQHQVNEMEEELKAISTELARSIRREMELEDLVERLQERIQNPPMPGRRSSDYFSDSGYSSAKSTTDYEQAKEEMQQIQRKAELEKAQITLELTTKLQDERAGRAALAEQVQELSAKLSQLDMQGGPVNHDTSGRIKELERTCEDLRHQLSQERTARDSFQDVAGLRQELQNTANERDNLKDEVVPQLRARVEGLEAQHAESSQFAYDATKLQQEIQALRNENIELKLQGPPAAAAQPREVRRSVVGLSRPASTARSSTKTTPSRPASLSRSNTTRQIESRDALIERLRDVEAQRDALHAALKNLLERQEHQVRESQKKIKTLEAERDHILAASPRKSTYEKEVAHLRDEINTLRRRADEAVEQKWQVEKGLAGLKMDLDRAEAEVASLRALLREDILILSTTTNTSALSPSSPQSQSAAAAAARSATSASLEKAYQELQQSYADVLDRITHLELDTVADDDKTRLVMQRLQQALATALAERDLARQESAAAAAQVDSLQAAEVTHLEAERDLAAQLHDSARRLSELADQVQSQLNINSSLRSRLAEAVARGDAEQRASKQRISGLQGRLRTLEEQVLAAQSASEDCIAAHEKQIAELKEAHNTQLQRAIAAASAGPRSPRVLSPRTTLTSPRQSTTRNDLKQVEALKARVTELEGALAATDAEMQEIVSRMNMAQIEVLNLQEEREEVVRQTRRLQQQLDQERMRAEATTAAFKLS